MLDQPLSGGTRQRVVIEMALVCEPRLLIADEPRTAPDATIEAEDLTLIDRLRRETGTAVLLFRCNKLDEGPVEQIFENPQHDYTSHLVLKGDCGGFTRG